MIKYLTNLVDEVSMNVYSTTHVTSAFRDTLTLARGRGFRVCFPCRPPPASRHPHPAPFPPKFRFTFFTATPFHKVHPCDSG